MTFLPFGWWKTVVCMYIPKRFDGIAITSCRMASSNSRKDEPLIAPICGHYLHLFYYIGIIPDLV